MTDARTRVLSSVAKALADVQGRARTEPPVVEISQADGDPHELGHRFARELAKLQGTTHVVPDRAACAQAINAYLSERGVHSVAVHSCAMVLDIALHIEGCEVVKAADSDKTKLEQIDCGLLEASSLLADTGSAIVVLDNAGDRVLPYLPRTCVIVADSSALHATMNLAAVACIQAAVDGDTRGEALIVAGPSRTADIEKTLVLGAHGPQALAVFMIENQ